MREVLLLSLLYVTHIECNLEIECNSTRACTPKSATIEKKSTVITRFLNLGSGLGWVRTTGRFELLDTVIERKTPSNHQGLNDIAGEGCI